MIQAALVERFQKLVIDSPTIMMEPSLPVLAQYRSRLFESAARQNVVNRDLRAPTHPKPAQLSGDSPTRLIHPVDLARSEEHTSELQSPCNLVCRLLLEKKKRKREQMNVGDI